jgi:Leucine-rich repeat (LRR) protein
MAKNQKLSSPKKNTPSSKPYGTEFVLILLQNMTDLQHLVLAGNNISELHHSSIPHTLRHLHLGRNNITHLNGTLR